MAKHQECAHEDKSYVAKALNPPKGERGVRKTTATPKEKRSKIIDATEETMHTMLLL